MVETTKGFLDEHSPEDGLHTFERVEDWISTVEDIFNNNRNNLARREALRQQTGMEKEAGADLWDARTSPEKTVNQSSKDGSMGDLHEKRRDVQQEIAEALREERRDSEELNDEKDRSALLQSYRDSCLERGKPALPQVLASLVEDKAPFLDLSGRGLGCGGIAATTDFLHHIRGLTKLDLSSNSIKEEGCTNLSKAMKEGLNNLKVLNLADNRIGHDGCVLLAETVLERDYLETLSVARNNLGDLTVAALVDSLRQTRYIQKVDVSHNKVSEYSCLALSRFVHKCKTLKSLNCNWAHMRATGAIEFSSRLQLNKTLTELDLSWNGFGDLLPCCAIAEALKSPDCSISWLNLGHNRIHERAASVLSIRLEENKSLRTLILDGNPLGRSGCRRILNSCLGKNSDSSAERIFTDPEGEQAESEGTIQVSMEGCNIGMVSGSSFDPSEPGGDYSLDMSDPYSQLVVRDLLKIAAAGRGAFVQGLTRLDNAPLKLEYEDLELEPDVPTSGELTCRFVNLKTPPAEHERMPDHLFLPLVRAFEEGLVSDASSKQMDTEDHSFKRSASLKKKQQKQMEGMAMFDVLLTGDTVMALDQAKHLLSLMKHRKDRVAFASQVFHKVLGAGSGKRMLQDLDDSEREEVMRILGPTSFGFTVENPTGHHCLDLSKKEEREVALKLRQWRSAEQAIEGRLQLMFAGHKGGPRDSIERTWRNCTLSKEKAPFESHEKVPMKGILELDFTAVSKPQDKDAHVQAINSDAWKELYDKLKSLDAVALVTEFRHASNHHIFKLKHIKQLLSLLDHEHSTLRVELVVTAWARTLDWHGYASNTGLLRTAMTASERRQLSARLGLINVFDPAMAVDYYELDLAIPDERFVVQELVHLATSEPGENCVSETLEGIDFAMPAAWVIEVPKKGLYTTFYCREKATIDSVKVAAQHMHPNSFSPDVEQPVGTEWVEAAKSREIKRKMQEIFPTPQAGFKMLDRDGGGSVDRKEMAVGLFKLGVWLHPSELRTLFSLVDKDNGGDVDEAEFVEFWDSH